MAVSTLLPVACAGPGVPPDPEQLDCLALTLYWEAGGEGRAGMEAVGSVVLNRLGHAEFPETVCAVVREGGERPGCQFSYWCDGLGDTPRDQDLWARARATAEDVLIGRTDDSTDGALYFHAASLPGVPWRVPRERTVRIGNHIYYR